MALVGYQINLVELTVKGLEFKSRIFFLKINKNISDLKEDGKIKTKVEEYSGSNDTGDNLEEVVTTDC